MHAVVVTTARRSLQAAARIGLLSAGVSVWWVVGLRTQGAYGLPVLQLTESLRTVAESSSPTDVLRGIGNWIFYGRDRLGFSIDQASDYLHDGFVVVVSFAIPVLALAVAGALRWRHRAYFVALVVVGTVVGVGAWPYDDPSPYGALFKALQRDRSWARAAEHRSSRAVHRARLRRAARRGRGRARSATARGSRPPQWSERSPSPLCSRCGEWATSPPISSDRTTSPPTGRRPRPRCSAKVIRRACSRFRVSTSRRIGGETRSSQ